MPALRSSTLQSLVLLLLLSCTERTSKEAATPQTKPTEVRALKALRWPSPPKLPKGAGDEAVFAQAISLWRTATTAYQNRAPARAAKAFMEVAKTLSGKTPTFASTRCLAYENASFAWAAIDPSMPKTEIAKIEDAACRHSLAKVQASLEPTNSTTAGQ